MGGGGEADGPDRVGDCDWTVQDQESQVVLGRAGPGRVDQAPLHRPRLGPSLLSGEVGPTHQHHRPLSEVVQAVGAGEDGADRDQ